MGVSLCSTPEKGVKQFLYRTFVLGQARHKKPEPPLW